jgi:hypothetical protein
MPLSMPLSREELESMIATALADYDDEVRAAWARIRIEPARWRCSPWGDEDGGFWAVAIEGDQVLWFNDIEDGFNRSAFSERGVIDEYRCDQTELTEILSQIAHEHSARAWRESHEHDVPGELAGPGTIVRRQTTYWELRAAAGVQYRVHFRDKAEVGFAAEAYPRVELVPRHPLLVQHEPSRSLYFMGTPVDPRRLAATLDGVVRTASEGWRRLSDYAEHAEARLRAGHGLLMNAPESVCATVAAALDDAGVGTSILGSAVAHPGHRVLLLGRSYAIARAFAFERRAAS